MNKLIIFFICIFFLLTTSCDQSVNMLIGVGQALDSQAPEVSVTSPENGIYINKSDITISGKCSDNVGVTRINAQAGIAGVTSTVTKNVNLHSVREGSWSVTFEADELERGLNLWRSGLKVTFTLTCCDAAGNSMVEHIFLYIDTDLPEVTINKPETRFSDDEKRRYENDVLSFKEDYNLNKFERVDSFVNGEFTIKGYVDDNYSVKSTYINIYDTTKKTLIAVTPTIYRDGTSEGVNEETLGSVGGNSQSWEFVLDSKKICSTEGWYALEVVTEDEAGNKKSQFVDKSWIYIDQTADIPKNNFISFEGRKLNAGNEIAGNCFDDDGIREVWIKIVPETESDPDTPYTDWGSDINEASYIIKKIVDFEKGVRLVNWSLKIPSKAGNYKIYAVPVDINGVSVSAPYADTYASYFSVASEEDPVIVLDSKFRGSTIVDNAKITGYFYDNVEVNKINVAMTFDEKEKKKILIYDTSMSDNHMKIIEVDSKFELSTGQIVTKYRFEWDFVPSDYPAYKTLSLTFTAEDKDKNYGEDAITVYGDSERPAFVGAISPANNSNVEATNVFTGTVSDNVDVVSVTIKTVESSSWKEDVICSLGDSKKVDGKTVRSFTSREILPAEFGGWSDREFTITAKDAVGNEASQIITLKGDKNKPEIAFVDAAGGVEKSGNYVTKSKILNVRITPKSFDDGTQREIIGATYLTGTQKSEPLNIKKEGNNYTAQIEVSKLGNISGDVTLQVTATDDAGNEGQGTIYFIVDNEEPNALAITSPLLKNKAEIENLTDDIDAINENDISAYQNGVILLKGTVADNYKIDKTVLNICNMAGKSVLQMTLTADENGKLFVVAAGDKESAFINGEYSGIPGNFTIKLDTTKFDNGNYVLKTTSYDAAGNSKSWGAEENGEYYFKILQEADRPRITFNIESGTTIYPGTMLKGLLIDDDAIGRVRYILEKDEFNNAKEMFDAPNDKNVHELANVKQYTRQDWMLKDISGIGMYHLYMLAEDIYGTESKLYTLEITVTSPDSAFIKSISSKVGNGGSFGNGYYSGNVKIMVGAAAGGESKLEYMYYRITASDTDTNSSEVDHTAEPAENFVFIPSGNLGGWHKYKFSENEAERDDIELEFDSRLFVENNTETITVEVRCQDGQAISATVKDKISIDNEGVSLKVTSPLSKVSVNKTFEILGSCNDRGAGVGDIYIGYMKDSAVQNITLADINNNLSDEPTLNKWKKIENDGISWGHEYVSTLINNSASIKDYKVQIAAMDILGNIGVMTHDIKIDQDGDRPIIRCQNLPLQSNAESWCKVSSIYGTVSDDDGGISEFYISEDGGTSWSENCYHDGSWMHNFKTDGGKELYFKVVDGKNTEFISKVSNILETPKIVDSTGSEFGYTNVDDTGFKVRVDTNNPSLTSIYYNKNGKSDFDGNISETDWDSAFIDKVFGGDEKTIYILFGATDANGIDIDKTKLECSTINLSDKISPVSHKSINEYEYFVYKVDISSVNNSYLTFKTSVTDNSGLPTATTFQVNIDNEAPSVVITNYSDNAEIYGSNENLIKGSTGDAHKTKSVEYAFSITSTEPDSGEYKHLEDSEGNNFAAWEAKFKENALNDEIKRLYGIEDFEKDNYDLYFWVKATDIFGNTSKATSVCLNVLPNGDKPTVDFSYPTGGEILGGIIRITGTAQVLTGEIESVYIQMDLSYDGNTFNIDSETSIDSVSKTNWSLTINKEKNLIGKVGVRAKATSNTRKSTLSKIVSFQVDKNVPLFGQSEELTLVQYDNNGNELKRKPYEADTWVSGEGWSLEGSVEDDSGIAEIKNDVLSGNVGTIEMTEEKRFGDNFGHSFKIPLETRDFGNISFILKAIDKSGDNPASNTASITVNYDNTAPTFTVEELSSDSANRTKIENRNGIYTINGTFEETGVIGKNQSGFERIAMFFTRTVNGTTYVIDPMLQKGTGNRYALLKDDSIGMYWREGTAESMQGSDINISSIPENVRPGGLCKISETVYRINSISSNKVTVSGTLPTITQSTPVYFAIAQVIDNQTIESGKTTYYGDTNTITYDDGDKMVEGVYRSGANYEWTVSVNSENIFDGDVDVHFVAFDKAGNFTKETLYTSVANNAPRIAGVTLAMDNNVNGSIDGNETQTGFSNIYNATVSPSEGRLEDVSVNGKLPNGNKVTELKLPLEGS
ncbi:MAG: Ig-like domain-containing protein, partial [Spirochaetota bacterium]|nr:Ig-like domain-containing protein [Spirochaetota bacterium]